jgi:hypothetical protein
MEFLKAGELWCLPKSNVGLPGWAGTGRWFPAVSAFQGREKFYFM